MTLYESIQDINERLTAASRQRIANARDPSKAVAVDDKAIDADTKQRVTHYRDVAKQFLTVYFDPSLVKDGESVLVALYRLVGGEPPYQRVKCGPIMDGLLEYEIAFSDEGDLILMRDESIAWACKALGFTSEVVPGWEVTTLPTGHHMLCKKQQSAEVPHG
jgi:hypothetical protein